MNDSVFQDLVDILVGLLPEKWSRVIYRADYTAGSYSMKYYVDSGDGTYIDCFRIGSPSRSEILKTFRAINKVLSSYREHLSDEKKWSVLTMKIEPSGKFRTDFDYANINENPISYQEDWEKRYLR